MNVNKSDCIPTEKAVVDKSPSIWIVVLLAAALVMGMLLALMCCWKAIKSFRRRRAKRINELYTDPINYFDQVNG